MGHARALLGAPDVEGLADQVIARGLSVRDTEKLTRERKVRRASEREEKPADAGDADIAALERQLADLLGVTVTIAHGPKGGTLSLAYSTLDQLDMICQRLTGEAI
jgi:ParB family chromosome partitioning protein